MKRNRIRWVELGGGRERRGERKLRILITADCFVFGGGGGRGEGLKVE